MRSTKVFVGVMAAVVVVVSMMQVAEGARILMVLPCGTRSHKNFFMAIAENLVQRNHTVTFVTAFQSSRSHPGIREVFVPDGNIFTSMTNLFNTSLNQIMWEQLSAMATSCTKALAAKDVQDLFKEEFDLVMMYIYMTECFLSFVHKLKVPFVYVSPNVVHGGYNDLAGTPYFPSLKARSRLRLEHPLTLGGRMVSTLFELCEAAFIQWLYLPNAEAECRRRQLCPEDMPSFKEFRLNSSLFIANSLMTLETPTLPYPPTVVHAGGIQCRPAQPLPQELQEWVAEAGKPGIILFSLGTFVRTSDLTEMHRRVLVQVFASLRQRVLWKWDEDTMPGLPPNVRLSKWLPQQDILGHPQLRLFITHGGMLSTREAAYHGVPVLGLPVFVDQHENMAVVQRNGLGRVLLWDDLTYDSLRGLVLDVMEDTKMRQKVQQHARVMWDLPISPGNWTTYWVEYVMRHQGATHLRSPAGYVPWYQLYNVDVWALVVAATLLVTALLSWLCYKTLRVVVRCCCGSRKTKTD